MKRTNRFFLCTLLIAPFIFNNAFATNKTNQSGLPIYFADNTPSSLTVSPNTEFELVLQSASGMPTLPFAVTFNSAYLSLTGGSCTTSPGSLSTPMISSGSTCTLNVKVASTTPTGTFSSSIGIDYNGRGIKTTEGNDLSLNIEINSTPPVLYGVTGDGSGLRFASETLYTLNQSTANATFFMSLGGGSDGEEIASDGNNLYHWSGYPDGDPTDQVFERIDLDNKSTTNIPLSGDEIQEPQGATFYKAHNAFIYIDFNDYFFDVLIDGVVSSLNYSYPDYIKGLACYQHNIYTMSWGTPASLIQLNPDTGTVISQVSITLAGYNVRGSTGIAINPSTGEFYALLKVQGSTPRKLVTINPTTGVATLIGNADDGSDELKFASIAFHPANRLC